MSRQDQPEPRVVLVGTLDTKGDEYDVLRSRLQAAGVGVSLIDVGVLGSPGIRPDIDSEQVAREAGADLSTLRGNGDRGQAIATMADGAARIVRRLVETGQLDGLLVAGGSNAGTIFASVAPMLPFGTPKVLLATIVAGETRPYIGDSDVTMIYPVVDIAGLNVLSRQALANAAGALAGMVRANQDHDPGTGGRRVVAATMFGVTTAGVTAARKQLEAYGYEVLVFHANGQGGAAMEHLIRQGRIDAVLDLTTTEIADELVGGVCSAGPARLTAAARAGIPQVVSLGALDMVNFGPSATVPESFRQRRLYQHNDNVTLMRTSPAECAAIGTRIGDALAMAPEGHARVYAPRGGFSAISGPGGIFHDPEADQALIDALHRRAASTTPIVTSPKHINDEDLARDMADALHHMLSASLHVDQPRGNRQ